MPNAVGEIQGEVFRKFCHGPTHMLRKPPAWCISKAIVEQLKGEGVTKIHIYESESGVKYSCTLEKFLEKSFEIQRGGFEPQLALPLGYWDLTSYADAFSPEQMREYLKSKDDISGMRK